MPTSDNQNFYVRLKNLPKPLDTEFLPLIEGMRDQLIEANEAGTPPLFLAIEAIHRRWPTVSLDNYAKMVIGRGCRRMLGPNYAPARRKLAPSGSLVRTGTLFVQIRPHEGVDPEDKGAEDEPQIMEGRLLLEHAAKLFALASSQRLSPFQVKLLREARGSMETALAVPAVA